MSLTYLIELVNDSGAPSGPPMYLSKQAFTSECGALTYSPFDALKVDQRDVAIVLAYFCAAAFPPELSEDRWMAVQHGFG